MNFGTKTTTRVLILAAFGLTAVACSKGSITSTGSSTGSGAITVDKVFPSSQGAGWTAITSGGRFYIRGLNLSITGGCSRGIAKIKVNEGGPDYAEEATCDSNGSFTWSRAYTATVEEGDKTLTLTAYDVDDAVIAGTATPVSVRVDATAPPAPVVTTPASDPYQHMGSGNTFNIIGTVAADVVRLTGNAGVLVTPTGVNWNHTVTLTQNSVLDFTYYAYDLAGNQSVGVTPTIQWSPSLNVIIAGPMPGGFIADGVSLFSMESSVFADPSTTTGTGAYRILTGLNNVTNQVRAD